MNRLAQLFFALLLAAGAFYSTGCTSANAHDSSIPWSRPADWEGQVPGMGMGGK